MMCKDDVRTVDPPVQLVMVCFGAVWFLKPVFVKELLRVTVPTE